MKNKMIIFFSFFIICCTNNSVSDTCYYMGKELFSNPQGGCYYINVNYNKSYVDSSYCNCLIIDSLSVDI